MLLSNYGVWGKVAKVGTISHVAIKGGKAKKIIIAVVS